MASTQTIEAQIQKRVREIEQESRVLLDLQEKEAQLRREMEERDETHDQLEQRLVASAEQIKDGDAKLARLKREYERRLENRKDAVATEQLREARAQSMTPREGINILMDHLKEVQKRLRGIDAAEEAKAATLGQVTVFYEATGDAATFRLTPTYTFRQLTADACRYWNVDPRSGTLRDEFHALWPTHAAVQDELSKFKDLPRLFLVATKLEDIVGKKGSRGTKRRAERKAGADGDDDDVDDDEDDEGGASSSEEEPEEYIDYIKAVQRTKEQMGKRLSPFFHGPRHSRAALKFEGFTAEGENEATRERENMAGNLMSLVLYGVFLLVLFLPIANRHVITGVHDVHRSMRSTLLEQRFDAPDAPDGTSTFEDMNTVQSFYNWLDDVLLVSVFQAQTYSGRQLVRSQQGLVRGSNQLVGGIRMRQYRVSNSSCDIVPRFSELEALGCYDWYSFDRRVTSQYGPGITVDGFTWFDAFPFDTFRIISSDSYYDRSGYAVELPNDSGKAAAMLANLRSNDWVDRATRAVVITFNLLNVNYNLLSSATIVVEFSPAGGLIKDAGFDIINLSMYDYGGSFMVALALMDLVATLYALYAVYAASVEGMLFGVKAFLGTLWNLLDLLICASLIALGVLRILYDTIMTTQLDPQVPHYVQVNHVVDMYNAIVVVSALVCLLATLNILKFFRGNIALSRIWQTIAVASGHLGAYFFIFTIVMLGFVLAGYFLFGSEVDKFSTVATAGEEVLFMLTGNVAYDTLREVDPVAAPIFFAGFVFLVFFVMVNFFLAILNDAYFTVNNAILPDGTSYWFRFFTSPFICFNRSSVRIDPKKQEARERKAAEKAKRKRQKQMAKEIKELRKAAKKEHKKNAKK
mmetsp:Transcript_16532/g.52696  ORF Transcript_16532/g.52696 Transcript_16532/m.52696 type:complete len:866 (+) Transcript_16532:86-2683(+)